MTAPTTATARCSLGWITLTATDRGACAIALGDRPGDPEADDPRLAGWLAQLVAAADDDGPDPDFPLDQGSSSPFQRQVWAALRAIPRGTTTTYAELAARLGRPDAVRAVGRACATNPLAIAVPCHRVVRADGHLGGYRWGLDRKRALLDREAGRPHLVAGTLPFASAACAE